MQKRVIALALVALVCVLAVGTALIFTKSKVEPLPSRAYGVELVDRFELNSGIVLNKDTSKLN